MLSFKNFISEGIEDKGIFKAIFIVGLPGSGKSYTIKKISGLVAPVIVNTDKPAEYLSKKWGKKINSMNWSEFKDTSQHLTKMMLTNYINSMLPLFIDGTSNDISNILARIGILESLGYDVGIVFINTDLDTAKRRVKERAEKTGREVDEDFIDKIHEESRANRNFLKSRVHFFKEVDNYHDVLDNDEILEAYKAVQRFFGQNIINPIGINHVKTLREENQKYLSPSIHSMKDLRNKIEGWYR